MRVTRIIKNTAGSSRRARRIQKALESIAPRPCHSPRSSEVIRKPLITKNASTPRKPPGNQVRSAWYRITTMTASARNPSIPGTKDSV
ncbi:MAG: hypothetical protein Q7O66_00430 [Dehalococcoidia bacterium]|nr:hypothetical protein [Dehalococcoidia bacterium]